jgi:hypothetical protein
VDAVLLLSGEPGQYAEILQQLDGGARGRKRRLQPLANVLDVEARHHR